MKIPELGKKVNNSILVNHSTSDNNQLGFKGPGTSSKQGVTKPFLLGMPVLIQILSLVGCIIIIHMK